MERPKELLLRRAGFGLNSNDQKQFAKRSYADIVETLVSELQAHTRVSKGLDPFADGAVERAWLTKMLSGKARLSEKLALFWHGHFATSNFKVANMQLMWEQLELFRRQGSGDFSSLLLGVSKDPAMILWLDNNTNRRSSPNENYAREVMELFCLGVGHYTETDIRELARALSGWSCRRGEFVLQAEHHDTGSKTILGKRGTWTGDQAVQIVARNPRCLPYIAKRLGRFFAGQQTPDALAQKMARSKTIAGQLRQLFLSDWFKSSPRMVKSPVELLLGALRESKVVEPPEWCPSALERMGQGLFYPPSVKGWDGGLSWLSAGFMTERLQVMHRIDPAFAHPSYQIH